MPYVEMWLEMSGSGGPYRVAVLIPPGTEIPEGLTMKPSVDQFEGQQFFVSNWYEKMLDAKDAIMQVAKFYTDLSIQFLFFRELRKPLTE
jgi:hypothetical protein